MNFFRLLPKLAAIQAIRSDKKRPNNVPSPLYKDLSSLAAKQFTTTVDLGKKFIRGCCCLIPKKLGYLCFIIPFYNSHAITLNIGTLSYNPPFETTSGNQINNYFLSFEIELMNELCKRIQAKCHFTDVPFDKMQSMLSAGKIDLGIGAIIITPEKRKEFLFSLPYKASQLQYLERSKSKMKRIQELTGKTIGVHLSPPLRLFVLNQNQNTIQVNQIPNSLDMLRALDQEKVSAVLTNHHQALHWTANSKDYKLLGCEFSIGEGYGIMTHPHNHALIHNLNKALLEMEIDGTYIDIYKHFF